MPDLQPPPPAGSPVPETPSSSGLLRSASVISAATMTSRLLGLIRDQVLAYLFGAGNAMDAFYVGFRIPNLMRDLFAEGAMSAAFVPTFTKRLTAEGRTQASKLSTLPRGFYPREGRYAIVMNSKVINNQ